MSGEILLTKIRIVMKTGSVFRFRIAEFKAWWNIWENSIMIFEKFNVIHNISPVICMRTMKRYLQINIILKRWQDKIGRASCRERVASTAVAVSRKTKKP